MRERIHLLLVHHPTLGPEGKVISSAITSLDLHDFCRLACTYGLGGVFAQTDLPMQAALVERLLRHWVDGGGREVNPHRRHALQCLTLVANVAEAAARAEERWGEKPLLFATSARYDGPCVGYGEAREVLGEGTRPALLLFGTAWGLAPGVIEECDGILEPIGSPSGYNHLSVRSAASIIVDRLFG